LEISVKWNDLFSLIGKKISKKEISKILSLFKCRVKEDSITEVKIEVPIDRLDLFSVEGVSRVIRNYLGRKVIIDIEQENSDVKVYVSHEAMKIRPCVSCTLIENISLSRDVIKQIQQFQEKVHNTYCRGKRKASIFVHDFDKITPPITFTCKNPDEIKFTPLGEDKVMNAKQILTDTNVGRLHGHLFFALERHPVIVDSKGNVLSIPMLTCSEETRIDEGTSRIFIEVTGVEEGLVNNIINVTVANMTERGGKIRTTIVSYPHTELITPILRRKVIKMDIDKTRKLLNINLEAKKIVEILERAGYGVKIKDGKDIDVLVPYYRFDVTHVNDVIEDILLVYGFNDVESSMLKSNGVVRENRLTRFIEKIREYMIGLGYQEILNYTLIDEKILHEFLGMDEENSIKVLNVISPKHNTLRTWLLPGILEFLSENIGKKHPQKVFEIGYVTKFSEKTDTKSISILKIASAISDSKASYEKIAIAVYLMLKKSRIPFNFEPTTHSAFIPGRTARVIIGKGQDRHEIGILGEIHPRILMKFKILNPVVAFELNLQKIFKYILKKYGGAAEI